MTGNAKHAKPTGMSNMTNGAHTMSKENKLSAYRQNLKQTRLARFLKNILYFILTHF
jgi:hypothetical protein